MPPQRTPLRAVDGNRPQDKDLTLYMRKKIVGMANDNASVSKIQAQYEVSRQAVRGSLRKTYKDQKKSQHFTVAFLLLIPFKTKD